MNIGLLRCQHVYSDNGETCNHPAIGHLAVKRSDGRLSAHDFVRPEFPPQEPTFEVWEVKDGTFLRLASSDLTEERARHLARTWTEEYAPDGCDGGFLAVEVIVKRSLVIHPDDVYRR